MELAFSPYWDDSPYRIVSIVRIESWEGLLICKTTPRHYGLFLPWGIETKIGNGRLALTTWCRAVRPLKGGDRGLPEKGWAFKGLARLRDHGRWRPHCDLKGCRTRDRPRLGWLPSNAPRLARQIIAVLHTPVRERERPRGRTAG